MLKQRVPLFSVLLLLLVGGFALAGRNSGGTYSLPAGNPVVSGTTITSTWANNTLNDLKTEMTSSLDRQGRGGMLAALALTNGTSAAPALTFSSEPSSGLYRASTNDIRAAVATVDVLKLQSSGVASLVPLTVSGRTTTTDLTVSGTCGPLFVQSTTPTVRALSALGGSAAPGIIATGGTTGSGIVANGGPTNGIGGDFAGNGSGAGARATGGASGDGVTATGGGAGPGVRATGGATGIGLLALGNGTQAGIDSTGGASAGSGVVGRGGVGGTGGAFQGSVAGNGVVAVAGSSGIGVIAQSAGSTGSSRTTALQLNGGDIFFNSITVPASTTAMSNRLTASNVAKVFGSITIGAPATTAAVQDGFNIASVAMSQTNPNGSVGQGNDSMVVTFASAFANSNYTVTLGSRYNDCVPIVRTKTSTTMTLVFGPPSNIAASAFCSQSAVGGNYSGGGVPTLDNNTIEFTIFGAQ